MTFPSAAGAPPGFPNCPQCPYRVTGHAAICVQCALATVPPLVGDRCPICAQQTEHGSCRNAICRRAPHERGFGTVSAISVHSSPLADVLSRFKYDGMFAWSWILGRLVLGWLDRHAWTARGYTLILANPSFISRQPYQHVEMILDAAATEDVHRRWPIHSRGLVKPVETPRSAGGSLAAKLAAAQQHAAVLQVAQPLLPALAGARVLLVDDVFTTGAQFDAVGRQLRSWGVAHVDGLVIARAPWR